MKERDVFLVHGVENKIDTTKYFEPFCQRIRKHLTPYENENVRFHPVNYSVLLESKEVTIYSWMKKDHWKRLRWVGCNLICDVLAYAYPKRPPQEGDFIYDVTKLLADKFAQVSVEHPKSEKWLICHSLGCVVGFGFSWDVKITGLITMGNPHDYFSVRYKNFGEDNKELPCFINFHNPWDPISTRVSSNPNFNRVTDVTVFNHNPLKKLPIRAHLAYWVNQPIGRHIATLLIA